VHRLTGLTVRDLTVDITVRGTGAVSRCTVDGVERGSVPLTLTGHHTVDITLAEPRR
jgi:hypothetical protein